MSKTIRITALAALFAAAPLTAALADRAPDAEESAMISDILLSEGYSSWNKIEWDDDGHWEVDDAVAQDGKKHDLTLDQAFVITSDDQDDDDDVKG